MAEGNKVHRRSLSEAVQGPQRKPALGPPHDVYAAVGLTFAGAGMLFFAGRARVEWDALGWTGMLICCAALVAIVLILPAGLWFLLYRMGQLDDRCRVGSDARVHDCSSIRAGSPLRSDL